MRGSNVHNLRELSIMYKNTIRLLPILFLISPVAAEESFFYGGVGYGDADIKGKYSVEEITWVSSNTRLDGSTNFIEGYIGYQVSKSFSLEFSHTDFDKFTEDYRQMMHIEFIPENDTEIFDLKKTSLRATFQHFLNDDFSLYALLGYSNIKFNRQISGAFSGTSGGLTKWNSDSESDWSYGIGLKMKISNNVSFRLQNKNTETSRFDISSLSLSAEMRF